MPDYSDHEVVQCSVGFLRDGKTFIRFREGMSATPQTVQMLRDAVDIAERMFQVQRRASEKPKVEHWWPDSVKCEACGTIKILKTEPQSYLDWCDNCNHAIVIHPKGDYNY